MLKFEPYKYFYQHDWTDPLRQNAKYIIPYKDQCISVLEIGVCEGRSGVWWLENILTHPDSRYVGVDDFYYLAHEISFLKRDPYDVPKGLEWCEYNKQIAYSNLRIAAPQEKWWIIENTSVNALTGFHYHRVPQYDIIYIDAGHEFANCFVDCILGWPLTKDLMIWDDYGNPSFPNVGRAVRHFLSIIPNEYDVVFDNYQIGIRKRSGLLSRLDFVITKNEVQ